MPSSSTSCSQVSIFEHPITSLPLSVQRSIRETLRQDLISIMRDPGMGLTTDWPDAKLDAIQIRGGTTGGGLYAVHWEHPQFGVNGPIWIVEVGINGARNIGPPASKATGSFTGYGMHVFPGSNDGYPGLMFAAKGYRKEGGAEAEAVCTRKIGSIYSVTVCPTDCFDQLNSH